MNAPYAFFSACDAPFLKKELITKLIENIDKTVDIIMPETSFGMEPLCAIYSKRCLQPAERHLARGQFKIQWAFRRHRIKKIPEKVLRATDPDLLSFFNINTPQDLAQAEAIINKGH